MKHEGTIKRQKDSQNEICTLINSNYYFVGNVFITCNKNHYRLVASLNGKLLYENSYPTLRGAKIAFSKLFGARSWREGVKARWSDFYQADDHWIEGQKDN